MMSDKVKAIEAQMFLEAKQAIAENRNALDSTDTSLRQRIRKILGYSEFGTDAWLISPSGHLDGKCPLEVLKIDSSKVVEAAIAKSNWKNPG